MCVDTLLTNQLLGEGEGGRSRVAGIAYCADRSVAVALSSRCVLISLS